MNRNIATVLGCDNSYEEAKIVVFGAPFDSTTSFRPGTRFASSAVRNESYGLETYSPYQKKDLNDFPIFDGGDLELPFGNAQKAVEKIEDYTAKIIQDQKIPCMIGGEHLVTLGAVRAAVRSYPNLHVLHFDAHADLREEYLGESLSHATVMRRVWELTGDYHIHQFGIRSGCKEEFAWAPQHVCLHPFNLNGLTETLDLLAGVPVYLSIDLDVLDPSVFPGTGTPEAGGITFAELLLALMAVNTLNIIGCDLNELSPVYDPSGVSTATACKLLRELLLGLAKK